MDTAVIRVPPQHFIANAQVAAASGETLPMIDPSDGHAFAAIARGGAEDVIPRGRSGAARARRRLGPPRTDGEGTTAREAGALDPEHADELATIEARDCGKPLSQAKNDVTACARYFEFYGGACDKLHGDTLPYTPGYTVLTWREAARG